MNSSVLKKFIASCLVVSMTFGNIALVSKTYATTLSTFFGGNDSKQVGNDSVEFDVYFEDGDVQSLYATKDVNANLDFSLFVPGYRQMIKRAKGTELENSSSSKKQGILFDDLFEVFFKEEQEYLKEVLENNKLIPQEIVPFTLLSKEE